MCKGVYLLRLKSILPLSPFHLDEQQQYQQEQEQKENSQKKSRKRNNELLIYRGKLLKSSK